jgi:hypothetical protein
MKLTFPLLSPTRAVSASLLFTATIVCATAAVEARPFGGSSVSISVGSGVGPCRTGIRPGYGYQPYCAPVYRPYTPFSTCQPYYWPNYSRSVSTYYYGAYPVAPATVVSTAPLPPAPHYQTYPPYSSVPGRVYDGFSVPSARPVTSQSRNRTQTSSSSQSPKVYEQTVQIQAALRKLGYYTGSVDGLMGPATQTAIRTFQIDHGLSVTGKVDDKLQKALEKEAFGDEQR